MNIPKPIAIAPSKPVTSTESKPSQNPYDVNQAIRDRKDLVRENNITVAQAANLAQNEIIALQTKSEGKWDLEAMQTTLKERTDWYYKFLIDAKKRNELR